MLSNFRMIFIAFLVGAGVVYGVFSLPTLTNGGTVGSSGMSQVEFDSVIIAEKTFCLKQPENINCRCFAKLSGSVQAHREPRVPGAIYADKQQLARDQAGGTC